MKKLAILLALCCGLTVQAQENENSNSVLFKHIGVAANVGTNGLGFDVGTTLTPNLEMRLGWDAMSRFTYETTLNMNEVSGYNAPAIAHMNKDIDFNARSNMKTGKMLLDIFPNPKGDFRFTVGFFYASNEKFAEAVNTSEEENMKAVHEWNAKNPEDKIGVKLGDYLLEPDEQGHIHAAFVINRFQPYVGIGFGHAVPRKNRLAVSMDFGVKYWGKPTITCNQHPLTDENINDKANALLKLASNLSVWPVINFRVACRLF